jgi:RNA polymerase sigma factor (sigma-70 family)
MVEVGDEVLLAAWQAGDSAAGNQLVARYFDSICRFFRAKLGDDVEDLIQRTFLDCMESKERITAGGFRAYIYGIARNRLFDHLRHNLRHKSDVDVGDISMADLGTSPSQHLTRTERQALLLRAMQTLTVDQQIALELAYWEGLGGPEIAKVLGIAENTVRSRLARAREALREALAVLAPNAAAASASLESLESHRKTD